MKYRTKTVINSLTGQSYFGYSIEQVLTMDGAEKEYEMLKDSSPSQWGDNIEYISPWYTVANKTSGTTSVTFNLFSNSGRDDYFTYSMGVDPAYTSITSFTVAKRSETTVTYNFTTADTVDYVWYSVNNGSNWTGYDITDGTSGSFTVSGLSPNTTYNFKLRVRRKDSQLTTDSSTVQQTTYKIPTQGFSSKAETRVTMNWTLDTTADYIWYSTNNGSSWTAVGSVNATSGSYTITGLSPNTAYNIKTRVRRKASQTTYDTSALSVTTYKAPTHALSARTETTASISWTADSTVDYIWYSTNNGSSWTGVDVADGTSGTYSISGLTANTTYQIKTRFRRKATQTNYDVGPLSVTTYNYPYITAVGTSALTIGSQQTLTLYNPLSRSVTVKMYQTNTSGTELYSGTTSGTSKQFTPTASTLYASIPNATSSYCVYSVIYGSSTKTTSSNTYSYKIIGTEVPTFSNFTYADTNSTITALTGNNQILVSGYSNVTATISTANKATANNSATMSNYVLAIGGQSAQANYSSSANVTMSINNVTSGTIKITATDSRGLGTSVTKTATLKAYEKPATTQLTATRGNNGVGEEVTLAFQGTWWNENFGSVTNAIQNIRYYFKKSNASSWTTGSTTITWTTSSNTFSGSLVVYGDTETHGFDVTSPYFIKIVVTDKLDVSEEYQVTLGTGTPAIAIYKDNVAIGQQYNTSTGGKLQVNGAVKASSFDGNASSSTYSTNVRTTPTDPSSGTTYYGTFINGNSANTNYVIRTNDGFRYETKQGTTSANGNSVLKLGNGTDDGTAGNKRGYLRLYSKKTGYAQITPADATSDTTHYLPTTGGTILNTGTTSITQTLTSGTEIGTLKINGTDTKLYCQTNTDKNVQVVETNPSSGTWYYPIWHTGVSGTSTMKANDGLRYHTSQGTTSAVGTSYLQLGNGTASGTAGNKRGYLRIYGNTAYYSQIQTVDGISANRTLYTPNHTGTIQTRATNLYNNTSGTNGTITLSETSANYNWIDIYYYKNESNLGYSVYGCQRVYSPNSKRVVISFVFNYTNDNSHAQTQLINRVIYFNGTSLTQVRGTVHNIVDNTLNGYGANNSEIKIVRVDGWK